MNLLEQLVAVVGDANVLTDEERRLAVALGARLARTAVALGRA